MSLDLKGNILPVSETVRLKHNLNAGKLLAVKRLKILGAFQSGTVS